MNSNPASKRKALMAGAALLGLNACLQSDEPDPVPAPVEKGILFALTSDYMTGNYSVIGIDSAFTKKQIDPVHSDAVVRYAGGDDIYILNRLGRDNLQAVDRHNLATVLQFKFPALSNPQDIVLKDSLLYVAFYGLNKIGIYRQGEGEAAGEIDVSAYADDDGAAETVDLQFAGGSLYALTQNLDTKHGYAPVTAHLLKIDVASKSVTAALELPYGNPSAISYDSASGKLYIPCRGEYRNEDFSVKTDGGIIAVGLSGFKVTDTLATEASLGGNVNPAILYDGKLILDVGTDGGENIVAVSLGDGRSQRIAQLSPYKTGGMAVDPETATLFLGDRATGAARLRQFDLRTYAEKTDAAVDLGAPPVDMVVVR